MTDPLSRRIHGLPTPWPFKSVAGAYSSTRESCPTHVANSSSSVNSVPHSGQRAIAKPLRSYPHFGHRITRSGRSPSRLERSKWVYFQTIAVPPIQIVTQHMVANTTPISSPPPGMLTQIASQPTPAINPTAKTTVVRRRRGGDHTTFTCQILAHKTTKTGVVTRLATTKASASLDHRLCSKTMYNRIYVVAEPTRSESVNSKRETERDILIEY